MTTKEIRTDSLRAWLLAARPKTLTGAAVPVMLGCGLAAADGGFVLLPAVLCLAFALLMQIDANLINDLWDYLLCVFENRVGATVAAALGEPYDEVQIPMPDAAQKMLGLRVRGTNTVPMRLLNAGEEGNYNDGMDSSITDYLQFYDPDADTAFSLPAWRVENTLYFNAQ